MADRCHHGAASMFCGWCEDQAELTRLQGELAVAQHNAEDAHTRCMEYKREADALRDYGDRYVWLRDWLVKHGLLHYERCQPEAGMKAGDYWVFRPPHMIDGTRVEAWAESAEGAIAKAMQGEA